VPSSRQIRSAASFLCEGTQQGPPYGVTPTGKRLSFTSCDIFRLTDGKIAEHWGMGDIAGGVGAAQGVAAERRKFAPSAKL
jgi:predicted ester cyclase